MSENFLFNPSLEDVYSKFDPRLLKVVGRGNFVAGCVGQTSTKTNALLYENLGAVLLIENSQDLIFNEEDSFGIEAVTNIRLFSEDHPLGRTIIFIGYSLSNPKEKQSLDHIKRYLLS